MTRRDLQYRLWEVGPARAISEPFPFKDHRTMADVMRLENRKQWERTYAAKRRAPTKIKEAAEFDKLSFA